MNKGMVFWWEPDQAIRDSDSGEKSFVGNSGKSWSTTGLASREFLELVPAGCEKIYVGKESGRHSRTQEEINGILVEWALKGKRVIRLKGGDPFVFGPGRRGDSEPLCPWDPL